jgi:aspartate ammonia-lyase
MLGEDEQRLREACLLIHEINLGATAIGTGITAHPHYARIVCAKLSDITGIKLETAGNLVEATQDCGAFVQVSGVLKRVAVKLSKSCNDLRLLSSGPRAGPGRNQSAADAGGFLHHAGEGQSRDSGSRQPDCVRGHRQRRHREFRRGGGATAAERIRAVIAHSLFKSLKHLRNGCTTLALRCVKGITANTDHLRRSVEHSIGIVTALNPHIGYANATAVAQEALASGKSVYALVLEKKLLSKERLDDLLRPENLTQPR